VQVAGTRAAGASRCIVGAMTIRMGYWDCPSCGHKKNPGPQQACAACGRPRDPRIQFYTDDAAPVVEDPELVARARAGADWKCKYCQADNRAGVMDCHQCGAGPDGTVRREQRFIPAQGAAPAKKTNVGLVLGIVGGALALLGALVWFLFLRTTALEATVESVLWVKTAALEQKKLETHSAWADEVPSGARELRSETRGRDKKVQEGTEKVKVGKKDLGNGMFEDVYEEKPKYVTKKVDERWVTYEIERWSLEEKLRTEAKDGAEPDDPAKGRSLGRDQRIGERTSRIEVKLEGSNGKRYTYEEDVKGEGAKQAKRFEVGKKYVAKVNTMGSVVSLGP
jgi:ribosomal protein L37E